MSLKISQKKNLGTVEEHLKSALGQAQNTCTYSLQTAHSTLLDIPFYTCE